MDKQLADMTIEELRVEFDKWDAKIRLAERWGSALAIADEYRRQCAREMKRRQK